MASIRQMLEGERIRNIGTPTQAHWPAQVPISWNTTVKTLTETSGVLARAHLNRAAGPDSVVRLPSGSYALKTLEAA